MSVYMFILYPKNIASKYIHVYIYAWIILLYLCWAFVRLGFCPPLQNRWAFVRTPRLAAWNQIHADLLALSFPVGKDGKHPGYDIPKYLEAYDGKCMNNRLFFINFLKLSFNLVLY